MDVRVVPGREAARIAADIVEEVVRTIPQPVLGVATGSSPLALYDELERRHREHGLRFDHVRAFLLDEYVGLPADHPERYRNVILRELAERVGMVPCAVHAPDPDAEDPAESSARFEAAIRAAGGVDVQILGIGTDGHIAFNEPGSSFASRTRVAVLAEQTRRDNARFFGGEVEAVPRTCLTQGLGTIMEARRILLLATGEQKAEAVRQLLEGPVSVRWPATVLQHHPDVTVLLDEAAASRLELLDHHRRSQALGG